MAIRTAITTTLLALILAGCSVNLKERVASLTTREVRTAEPHRLEPAPQRAPIVHRASARRETAVSYEEEPYELDSGDRLRVGVFGQENLSRDYAVDGGGYISMPLIGAVQARGITTFDLERRIAAKLKAKYVKDPKVTVEVQTYRPFFVLGEVRRPGQFPYVKWDDGSDGNRHCRRLHGSSPETISSDDPPHSWNCRRAIGSAHLSGETRRYDQRERALLLDAGQCAGRMASCAISLSEQSDFPFSCRLRVWEIALFAQKASICLAVIANLEFCIVFAHRSADCIGTSGTWLQRKQRWGITSPWSATPGPVARKPNDLFASSTISVVSVSGAFP